MKRLFFIFLALPYLVSSQEAIKIYGAKISAIDITGNPKFGPKNELGVSKLMTDPVIKSNSDDNALKDVIGRFVIKDLRSPSALLNMGSNKKLNELLDSISFDYYEDWAIPQLLNKDATISDNLDFQEFKQQLKSLKIITDKKRLIGEDKYAFIKQKLEDSRLDFIEKDFKQDQALVKTIKNKISANVSAALLENQLDLNSGLNTQLDKLVNKNISISGKYIEVYLKEKYIDYVEPKFRHYLKMKVQPSDDFSVQLNSYLKNKSNTIITGLSTIKITITYNAEKVLRDSITVFLKNNFSLDGSKLIKVTSDVFAGFDIDKSFSGSTTSNHYYILRYSYNTRLRIKNLVK